MTSDAQLVERIDTLQATLAPIAETAKAMGELKEELAPRVNEAVHALIVALADVEADFQLEDLVHLAKNGLRNVRNLNFTLDQLKNLIDFATTAEPLLKCTIPQIIQYLDELETRGVFRLLSLGLETLKQIAATYSAEQLQQVAEGIVRLVGILHKLTAPSSLELLGKAAELPARMDLSEARPLGIWGLMGALSDPQFKQALGVAVEMTKGLAELKD